LKIISSTSGQAGTYTAAARTRGCCAASSRLADNLDAANNDTGAMVKIREEKVPAKKREVPIALRRE